jgi:hypothetical protein
MVENRQKIKEGKYDIDKALATKWQSLGLAGQSEYYSKYESGENNSRSETRKSREIKDEDVEMGEEGEDEDESQL